MSKSSYDVGVLVMAGLSLGLAYAAVRLTSERWLDVAELSPEAQEVAEALGLSFALPEGFFVESDFAPEAGFVQGAAFTTLLPSDRGYPARLVIEIQRVPPLVQKKMPLSMLFISSDAPDQFLYTPLPGEEPITVEGRPGVQKEFVFATKPPGTLEKLTLPLLVRKIVALVSEGEYVYRFTLLIDEERSRVGYDWFTGFLQSLRFREAPREIEVLEPKSEPEAASPREIPGNRTSLPSSTASAPTDAPSTQPASAAAEGF